MEAGLFGKYCQSAFDFDTLTKTTLNQFAALGRKVLRETRLFIQNLLLDTNPLLRDDIRLRELCITERGEAKMHVPFSISDFTDFLNSRVVCLTIPAILKNPFTGFYITNF